MMDTFRNIVLRRQERFFRRWFSHKYNMIGPVLLRYIIPILLCCFTLGLIGAATPSGDDAPAWLRQAASTPPPIESKNVPAVVLLKERNVKVEEDGRVTTVERYAVRVLSNEGRGEALAAVSYIKDTGKVRDMRA